MDSEFKARFERDRQRTETIIRIIMALWCAFAAALVVCLIFLGSALFSMDWSHGLGGVVECLWHGAPRC